VAKASGLIAAARRWLGHKFVQDTLILQAGKIGVVALSLISSLLVWRLMGPDAFGVFALAQSFLNLWTSLDLTGLGVSTGTRLALAIGADDRAEILNLLAVYVQITTLFTLSLIALIVVLGVPVAGWIHGDGRIGALAGWLSLGLIADHLYALVIIAFQSRRSMRTMALLQIANQAVLSLCMIAAVLIHPIAESLVIARLMFSYSTLILALIVYQRLRTDGAAAYPPIGAVLARARTISARPYWRFGVANALDKNLAGWFTQIPLQIVGAVAGTGAAGYLSMALNAITQASLLSSAVFENLQAVVPQKVGRGEFAGLWRDFVRVLVIAGGSAIVFYGVVALIAPSIVPPLLGEDWLPAVPALVVLCAYGAITTVGGLFAPLYRAFDLMRESIFMKLAALALVLPVGVILLSNQGDATGGAFVIVGLFAVSVMGTAIVSLRTLRRAASVTETR
jgi:O-antigen/teichoic acid export membrane protein